MTHGNRLKSLLVAVSADEEHTHDPTLDYALGLAQEYQSRLTVYVFAPALLQPFPLTLGSSSVWIAQETDRIETLSGRVAKAIRRRADELGMPVDIEYARSPFEGRYARFITLARLHDMTILETAGTHDAGARRSAIEHALFDTGRPVLIASHAKFKVPKKVAIAWDGSAQASRAIRDGLDLLGKADHVAIATVVGMKGSEGLQSADELMKYLALYGIRSDIAVLTNSPGDDEGLPLRQFTASQQVDLLVMGAFVHSRLRQAIMGGMTHSLLADCPVPIVMSH